MRRLWILLLAAALAMAGTPGQPARAEKPEMRIDVSGGKVLPGEAVIVSFTVPEEGTVDIVLTDGEGETVAAVAKGRKASAGYNAFYWNGTSDGWAVPEGEWTMRLEMNGQAAETRVSVGRMIPCLISVTPDRERVTAGKRITVSFWATEEGTVVLTAGGQELVRETVGQGNHSVTFEAALEPGTYTAEMTLVREDGTASHPVTFTLATEKPGMDWTPLGKGNGGDWRLNAWTLPMDITDEEAVWQALTAPMTVLDDGKDKATVRQAVVRKEPDAASEGVATVTLASQGVYVLERGEEWSRIACYSSSFHDSPILNWNVLAEGWVETKLLKTVIPNQQMGIVVDKLTQRMYIFRDGKLFSTLLVSTGLANARQPYNETRSGEYLLVSRVGGFYSDNMFCPRAIRFNDGDMLHEVPYIEKNEIVDYSMTEPKLGTKASHGCIRVQRKKNPEGVNHEWLYINYRANTRILIWEDWQGRQIPVPADDTVFWRHPSRTDYYHCSDHCPLLNVRSPLEITYAEVSAETSKFRACPACGPVAKKSKLLEINALYAEGGDHDPVLTEARKSCPKKGR